MRQPEWEAGHGRKTHTREFIGRRQNPAAVGRLASQHGSRNELGREWRAMGHAHLEISIADGGPNSGQYDT